MYNDAVDYIEKLIGSNAVYHIIYCDVLSIYKEDV